MPLTNTPEERDVNMSEVLQQISGTFRSEQSAKVFCRTRRHISSLKWQELPVFEYIQKGPPGAGSYPANTALTEFPTNVSFRPHEAVTTTQ